MIAVVMDLHWFEEPLVPVSEASFPHSMQRRASIALLKARTVEFSSLNDFVYAMKPSEQLRSAF